MLCNECGNQIIKGEEIHEKTQNGQGGGVICKKCWERRRFILKIIFGLVIIVLMLGGIFYLYQLIKG